ncbi:helix-turn-helix transcriptional regulator [Hyphomicrobium sp. CS1GBMeth3]|uniref:helix-turn-helix transcriptional regulator n=1 Tax=Hyphomicrobium sp. CS1GBMeth3 TaxID=1892845 RepID=UPI0009303EFF|nr:helix-turn-helix transcriptional regulator [Hyphomicrobium sp. CS1GBMeth3]
MRNGFSDATLLDLVELIYAAGSDPNGWERLAERINKEMPGVGFALGCSLLVEGQGFVQHPASAGYDPDSIKSLVEHYQQINPYETLHKALPVGKAIKATSLVTRDWLERQVFYHEWLKPAGDYTHGAGIVIARDHRRQMRIAIDIPDRLGHLEEPCAQLLTRLGPHLARAFELNQRLEAAIATQHVLDNLLDRIDGAAAILGRNGHVCAVNRQAEALARVATLIKITPTNRMTFCKPAYETAFQRALAAALGAAGSNGPCAFLIEDRDGGKANVVVLPLRATSSGAAYAVAGAQALLIIREAGKAVSAPADVLRTLYRVTHAEAAVVLQIAAGLSLAEAADALSVSRSTARNQLTAAMAKLGVHRQAELVGLMAGLAPRLALKDPGAQSTL